MDIPYLIIVLLSFLAGALTLEALYNLWAGQHGREAKQIESRLSALAHEDEGPSPLLKAPPRGRLPGLQAALARSAWGRRLVRLTRAAGMASTAAELLAMSAALALIGLMGTLVLQRPFWVGLGLATLLGAAPWMVVNRRLFTRAEVFDRQFPEALDLMARALRAGHALPMAIRMCGDEMAQPIASEFRQLANESHYGVPLQEALRNLAERVPVPDMDYFVIAVMIQRETGGNMAELLDNISGMVRQRLKLRGEIRTLSAEGRLSGWVLALLPFIAALGLTLLNPKQMEPLWTHPTGRTALAVSIGMVLAGLLWIQRIVRVRV